MTELDLQIIDEIIAENGGQLFSAIPVLQAIQKRFRYIPVKAIEYVSQKTGIPAAQLYGVATFYSQFRLKPVGKHIIKVCHGTACHVAGAENISEIVGDVAGVHPDGGTAQDKFYTLESVACLGCCSLAPVVMIDDEVYGKLSRPKALKIVKDFREHAEGKSKKTDELTASIAANRVDLGTKSISKILIGTASCGVASGAAQVLQIFKSANDKFGLNMEIEDVGCIGMCHSEPIVEIISRDGMSCFYGHVDVPAAKKIISDHIMQGKLVSKNLIGEGRDLLKKNAFFAKQHHIVLENCGRINPESIGEYEKQGGYGAAKKVLQKISPEKVIDEITASGLRGRGGAGFPTGTKWGFVHKAKGADKFVICNADEGDPGAFMDRAVLESDPHRVLEGMIIAAYAIGAGKGYIYCRAEYPLAIKRLNIAIKQAREKKYLGGNILGSKFSFDIEIKEGAGAFVCGEETALIASVEGRRGMPRIRPPFPAQSGLFGMPTNINNVETYANIAWIVNNGAKKFAALGTKKSKGTKVFALAGDVKRGGLVEVPMGITLAEIVEDIGDGTKSGLPVKAIQLGGPSGGCIPARLMDVEVDYDSVNATGAIMGSGGMVVMDENTCMVDIAKFFLNFTQDESCGKCTFCRIGTRRMLEILTNITEGKGQAGDIGLLEELSLRIKEASLCGLGQTAPNPVLTTIKYFRDEYEAHINQGKCPAGRCRALITYFIVADKCIGCGACIRVCPVSCIKGKKNEVHVIDKTACTRCGACKQVCPVDAVVVE